MEWVAEGSEREDDSYLFNFSLNPVGRFLNHFHHPLRPWDEAGLTDVLTGQSSVRWAQTRDQGASNTGSWSWQNTRDRYFVALTGLTRQQRDQLLAQTFRGLGHQSHLLQDAASVPHTRNEAHAAGFSLEKWTRDRFQRKRAPEFTQLLAQTPRIRLDPQRLQDPPNPLAPLPISRFIDAEQYDGTAATVEATATLRPGTDSAGQPVQLAPVGVGEYANANFVHRKTIFTNTLPASHKWYSPFPRRESTNLDALLAQGLLPEDLPAEDGLVDSTVYIAKIQHGEVIPHFLKPTYALTRATEVGISLQRLMVQFDDKVYEAYARRLLPRAVGASIDLLDYFFRGRLAVYAPPSTPGQVRVRNLSDEALDGFVTLYWDDDQGLRSPVTGPPYPVRLGPGRLPSGAPNPTSLSDPFPFAPVSAARGRYTAVFLGALGLETNAVIGRVLRPRLAFTGDTCPPGDPDPQCPTTRRQGLYRWDAGPPNEPATITPLTQRGPTDTFRDRLPAWSPDGSQLAFVSNKNSLDPARYTLWLLDAEGANRRQPVAPDPVTGVLGPIYLDGDNRPAWRPDGTFLAFVRQTQSPGLYAGNRDLFVYEVATGAITQLTGTSRPNYDVLQPAWAPDGTRLVVTLWAGGEAMPGGGSCPSQAGVLGLRIVNFAWTPGSPPTASLGPWLTTCWSGLPVSASAGAAWTPDGQFLLFSRTYGLCPDPARPGLFLAQTDLYELAPTGTLDPPTGVPPARPLTQLGTCAQRTTEVEPTVAPDGRSVALTSTGSADPKFAGSPHLHTLDRSGPLPVTSLPLAACRTCTNTLGIGSAGHPAWAPGLP